MFAFRSMSQKRSSQIKSVLQTCIRMCWMPVLAWVFDSADLFVGAGGVRVHGVTVDPAFYALFSLKPQP